MLPILVFALISIALSFLMTSWVSLTFFIAIFWGATLIISIFYLDRLNFILIFLINVGVLYYLAGLNNLFYYLTFFGLAVLVMGLLAFDKAGYYELQKWGIITAVIGVSLFLGILYLNTGNIGISDFELQLKNSTAASIKDYEALGMFEFYEKRGIMQADFEAKIYSIVTKIAYHLPAFYYLQAILAVFFMLFLATRVSLKRDIKRLNKKPYIKEIMPWQLAWLAIAGLILWLVGREKVSLIYFAGSNIILVLLPITVYFGLSALIFKFRQKNLSRKKWLIVLLVILAIIFPLSVVIFLSIFGLFDGLLDYRKLRIEEQEDI